MLSIEGLHAAYGKVSALENVSLAVAAGQIVCLLGANGAGKTTTLNCISGLVGASAGRIVFEGEDLRSLRVEDIVGRGIVQVPEGREIFTAMSVEDNLTLGAWCHWSRQRNRAELERSMTCSRACASVPGSSPDAVGRRAADADVRPGADGEAEAAHARRAEPRPLADPVCSRCSTSS